MSYIHYRPSSLCVDILNVVLNYVPCTSICFGIWPRDLGTPPDRWRNMIPVLIKQRDELLLSHPDVPDIVCRAIRMGYHETVLMYACGLWTLGKMILRVSEALNTNIPQIAYLIIDKAISENKFHIDQIYSMFANSEDKSGDDPGRHSIAAYIRNLSSATWERLTHDNAYLYQPGIYYDSDCPNILRHIHNTRCKYGMNDKIPLYLHRKIIVLATLGCCLKRGVGQKVLHEILTDIPAFLDYIELGSMISKPDSIPIEMLFTDVYRHIANDKIKCEYLPRLVCVIRDMYPHVLQLMPDRNACPFLSERTLGLLP